MKTALITGGSRGIGWACVLAFAQAGWQVAWCYRKEKEQSLALEQELKKEKEKNEEKTDHHRM